MTKKLQRHKNSKSEKEILLRSKRRCCFCFGLENDLSQKRGQIAHLDQDRSNDSPDNLVFLCLNHHDEYDSHTSQSKSIQMAEVKMYRDRLYKNFDQHNQVKKMGTVSRTIQPALDAKRLNYLLADKPHKCSHCGYSFSLLPDLKKGRAHLVLRAVCPNCGNVDAVFEYYEG